MDNQMKNILKHLQSGLPISPLEALQKYGCFRLGARIFDLKAMGYPIEVKIVKIGNKRFASYHLKKEERQLQFA